MSVSIKEAIKDCEDLAPSIMSKVDSALSNNNVSFVHNNYSEIIVNNTTKETVNDIIFNMEDVDSDKSKLLLQVTENNEKVYIRQKFN